VSGTTERFVALLVGIVAIIGGVAGMIRLLVSISLKTGIMVQQLRDHLKRSDEIHTDMEARMRNLELRGRR
jgi:hypothetical protein